MLFFRSEENVCQWCVEKGSPLRPLVGMEQLWSLAETWYSTRLQEDTGVPSPKRCAPKSSGPTSGSRERRGLAAS
jgi:hypothetical protein